MNLNFYSGNSTHVNTVNSTLFTIANLFVSVGPITGGLYLDGRTLPLELGFNYWLKDPPFIGKVVVTITTPEKVYPNSTGPYIVPPVTLWTNNTNSFGLSSGFLDFSSANSTYGDLAIQDGFTASDLWSTELFIRVAAYSVVQPWQFIVLTDPDVSVDGSQSSPSPPASEPLSASGYSNAFYWTTNTQVNYFTVSLIRPIWVELRPLYLSFLTVILGFYVGTYTYEKSNRNKHEHISV